jgi:hypothetical protein
MQNGAIYGACFAEEIPWRGLVYAPKEKREPFGSAQDKQVPALQTEFSIGLSIALYKGKSIGKKVPIENISEPGS